MKLRAIITAMVIALASPAFAVISDYESMHRRLADVLGSRAQGDSQVKKLGVDYTEHGGLQPARPLRAKPMRRVELFPSPASCNEEPKVC